MNTNNEVIRSEVDAEGFALLTIDYPGKTMNVIDQAFIDSLQAGVDRVKSDATIRGAIVTSGKDAFVAGADPVSYTHLDVYKRQALECRFTCSSRSIGEAAGAPRGSCKIASALPPLASASAMGMSATRAPPPRGPR